MATAVTATATPTALSATSLSATSVPRRSGAPQRAVVHRASDGAPCRFQAGGRHYVVTEVHGHWVTGTPWWLTGRDVDIHTWRVTIAGRGRSGSAGVGPVVDLTCAGSHWQLTRVGGAR